MTLIARPAPTPRRIAPGDLLRADDALLVREAVRASQLVMNATKTANVRPWAEQMLHQVTAIAGDYLQCVRVWRDAVLGTEIVYVARPALLRTSLASRDGVTYAYTDVQTRTASKAGETDETHRVTPTYLVGDIIEAVFVRGLSGVTQVDAQRRALVDANRDGRAWAAEPTP